MRQLIPMGMMHVRNLQGGRTSFFALRRQTKRCAASVQSFYRRYHAQICALYLRRKHFVLPYSDRFGREQLDQADAIIVLHPILWAVPEHVRIIFGHIRTILGPWGVLGEPGQEGPGTRPGRPGEPGLGEFLGEKAPATAGCKLQIPFQHSKNTDSP